MFKFLKSTNCYDALEHHSSCIISIIGNGRVWFLFEIREIRGIIKSNPTLPNIPNFPNLPDNVELAVNLMITLINQANYLIDNLIISLKDKHMKEGGLSEELYRKRKEYRGY